MPETFTEFLTFGTIGAMLGGVESYLIEYVPGWANVPRERKRAAMAAMSVILCLIIQGVNMYVATDTLTQIEPWYQAIASALVMAGFAIGGAEATHHKINSPGQSSE